MPPTDIVEQPPLPVDQQTPPKKLLMLSAGGLLLLLLIAGGVYWWFLNNDSGPLFPKNATVMVSLGFVPASPLVSLNAERTNFEANTLAPELSGKLVIDRVVSKKGEYLLILDPVTSVANIVMRSKESGGEPFVTVTDTSTMKFDLSYDEKSDTFVYLSKKLATPEEFLTTRDWDVTTYSGGVEKVIGTGLHAEVVPGKNAVVVGTFAGVLSWIPFAGGNPVVLMEREQAWAFTVRPNGKEIALYNPSTNQIDVLDVSGGPEKMQVKKSLASYSRPASLAYMGDAIVLALPDSAQSLTTFRIAGDKRELQVLNPYPDVPSAAYNVTIEL